MTMNATTSSPDAAILSQSELFQRYLDAPVRMNATLSTLFAQCGPATTTTARDAFVCGTFPEALPDGFVEEMLEGLAASDAPSVAIEQCIDDLKNLVENLKVLKRDFDHLAELTRTEEPDDDAPDEVHHDWEMNPRYVLPGIAA